jgi:predicted alpha/beta superfamily hydrolase
MNMPDGRSVREALLDGKKIRVYHCGVQGVPTVYTPMFMEAGQALLQECEKAGCRQFNLVTISGLRWGEELTPWAHEPVLSNKDHFGGKANEYTVFMTEKVIPFAEEAFGDAGSERILAGYSLAGLYAIYAPYVTDAFQRVASASGSLWYPDFLEFALDHELIRKPLSAYLSLGDRESRSRNEYVSKNQENTERLQQYFASLGIQSVFELNPGNHFNNATGRLAKGIVWTMNQK